LRNGIRRLTSCMPHPSITARTDSLLLYPNILRKPCPVIVEFLIAGKFHCVQAWNKQGRAMAAILAPDDRTGVLLFVATVHKNPPNRVLKFKTIPRSRTRVSAPLPTNNKYYINSAVRAGMTSRQRTFNTVFTARNTRSRGTETKSINQSIDRSIDRSIDQSINQSIINLYSTKAQSF